MKKKTKKIGSFKNPVETNIKRVFEQKLTVSTCRYAHTIFHFSKEFFY